MDARHRGPLDDAAFHVALVPQPIGPWQCEVRPPRLVVPLLTADSTRSFFSQFERTA